MTIERFREPLKFIYLDGTKWELAETVIYDAPAYPHDQLTIPAGWKTDFASIPRPFWALLPPTGQYGLAAVVHDWLWNHPALDSGKTLSAAEVDSIFLDAMAELNVPRLTRYTMYGAVRAARLVTKKR
jgi:Protein of unknown function (DUF1353)